FKTVSRNVVESDPVRENLMSIKPLDQELCFRNRGQPLIAFDIVDFSRKIGQQVLVIGKMGSIDGNRGDACFEHGRNLDFGSFKINVVLYSVMIGMDCDRYGYPEFIAEGIDDARHIPVIDRTVGFLAAFRLGYFDDHRAVGTLRSLKHTPYDKYISAVSCHGNGFTFSSHGTVDDLAADNKRFGIREEFRDVRRPSDLKRLFKICR